MYEEGRKIMIIFNGVQVCDVDHREVVIYLLAFHNTFL